jgi:two-component system response regulator
MTRTILLVEDNAVDEKLALMAFKKCGVLNIAVARDGAEALDYLFAAGGRAGQPLTTPSVVLLDLKLPRMDGFEVLRRIRANEPTSALPVVILTASIEAVDLARAYASGANAYLRKPIDFVAFTEAAKLVCQFWLGLNETAPVGPLA